jgi:hypothetical protein
LRAGFAVAGGHGRPAARVVADIVRMEDGMLAEHWDVIEDEATRAIAERLPDVRRQIPGLITDRTQKHRAQSPV